MMTHRSHPFPPFALLCSVLWGRQAAPKSASEALPLYFCKAIKKTSPQLIPIDASTGQPTFHLSQTVAQLSQLLPSRDSLQPQGVPRFCRKVASVADPAALM